MTYPIVIIGAGIGGMSAAIRLAAAGKRVVILEQNAAVGGKMGQVSQDGFCWDTGPSVITMRPVFEELFACAGKRLADYLDLMPLDPLTRYFYPDGSQIDASADLSKMSTQIARIDELDVEGYLAFLAYAARLHRITGTAFIYDQPPTWRSFLGVSPLDMVRIEPWWTMGQKVAGFVRSPQLRQLLGRFATYVGASPFLAPATLSVIAHVELTNGVWYPRGGIYRIAEALHKLCSELGIEVLTSCPVQQILVQAGRAAGVRLGDGTEVAADAVIANVDVTTVYQHLLPAGTVSAKRQQALAQTATSCSGFVLLLGVEGEHPQLAHHNIFFSSDYQREFVEIFAQGQPPQEPTIYVAITNKSDASHAPPGCENWFVLVNAPALDSRFDWASQGDNYRALVLARLQHFGVDLTNRIRSEVRLTPLEIARYSGAWRGALYGISSNNALNAFRRPHNRCGDVNGLYFVGGTTHPGGGVPMVMLSGKVVAQLVLEDLR